MANEDDHKRIYENQSYKHGIQFLIKRDIDTAYQKFSDAYNEFCNDESLNMTEAFCLFLLRFSYLSVKKSIIDDDNRMNRINEAIVILEIQGPQNSELYANCLFHLADTYQWKFGNERNAQLRESIRENIENNLLRSKQIFEYLNKTTGIIKCLELESRLLHKQNLHQNSLDINERVLQMYTENFDWLDNNEHTIKESKIADCYAAISESSGYLRDQQKQKESLEKALEFYENFEITIKKKQAFYLKKMSICTEDVEKIDNAQKAVRLYKELFEKRKIEKAELINAYVYLGDAYRYNNRFDDAGLLYEEAIEFFEEQPQEYHNSNSEYIKRTKNKLTAVNRML